MADDNMFEQLFKDDGNNENVTNTYDRWADTYEKSVRAIDYQIHYHAADSALRYCPGSPEEVLVLDVASGTGLVGDRLKANGFKYIDGVEPSKQSVRIAKTKDVYRNIYCQVFTKDPMDIPNDTYDIVVSGGAMIRHHLPYDCILEMVRLVRPGGIICIVSRESSFDNKSVPEYKDLVPLMKDLEISGKWRNVAWNPVPQYLSTVKGLEIVYEVL